jgi:hypothetical protein
MIMDPYLFALAYLGLGIANVLLSAVESRKDRAKFQSRHGSESNLVVGWHVLALLAFWPVTALFRVGQLILTGFGRFYRALVDL